METQHSLPPESPILRVSEPLDGKVPLEDLQFHPVLKKRFSEALTGLIESLVGGNHADLSTVTYLQGAIATLTSVLAAPSDVYEQQKAETKAAAETFAAESEEPGSAGWPLKR